MSDPMDRPPADFGSDRYDYVEVVGAPADIAPYGVWLTRLLAEPCPDCRANLFIHWRPDGDGNTEQQPSHWFVQIAHDDGCPAYARLAREGRTDG